jgi:ADP-heptose:LPS heptosyltransferase
MRSERALLVAAGGGLGDTFLATVVAQALRTRFAAVDALVLPEHRALVAHTPVIDRIFTLDALPATVAALARERYAAAVVTWATLPTAAIPFLARIPVRVGQARRLYSALFTERVVVRSERGDHHTHWTQILLDYARAIGCDTDTPQPAFLVTEHERGEAAALLRAKDVRGPYVLVHPTRGLAAQRERWPHAGFVALARALYARDGVSVLVSGARDDAFIAEGIAADAGAGVLAVAGSTSLGVFGALCEGARGVVAMDSGPMHLAAATGAPTVGIFALQSDEPDRWAPLGPRTAVVRASYPCPPGHRKETCPDFACVRALDVAAILHALDGVSGPAAEHEDARCD